MENPSGINLVLPCYNPPNDWEKVVVDSVRDFSKKSGEQVRLIIVNDGSTVNVEEEKLDFIREKLEEVNIISYAENRGKGYALRKGVEEAHCDRIIYTDIDFPYEEDSFMGIHEALKEGHDVVLGHRGKNYYTNTPWGRKVISKFLRWTLKTFLRLPTDDSQCGLKGFNQNGAAVFLDTNIDRFLFDLEFIKLSARRKLKIQKVEVTLKPFIIFSKVNLGVLLRESVNFMKVLFRK